MHIELDLPSNRELRKLFLNANWAYLIEPSRYAEFRGRLTRQIPATNFRVDVERAGAVNATVEAILASLPGIHRSDFAAIEWCLNEVTDNVLNHAESPVGGVVQLSTFQKSTRRVEFVVSDPGLGIPTTIRRALPELSSDVDALGKAIREGVTRDATRFQGNGLFGTLSVCEKSGGSFQVYSGNARLSLEPRSGHRTGELHVRREQIPFEGTWIYARIDCSNPGLLADALNFKGKRFAPTDWVELKYEVHGIENVVRVPLRDEQQSLGSRHGASQLRTKIANLATMNPRAKLELDFADVPVVSSSFADEVFGKLFLQLGPMTFMQRFELKNMSPLVSGLIDKAITKRAAAGR